ncbi:MAG: 50S ribosomal protein L29 [Candidatus Pacebacteria bacterium]|nr:50S ribosomal protein L29 [Candidatus Paceibacterota bacterium]
MKSKELEQLKNKSAQELSVELAKDLEKLWTLQIDLKAGKSNNVKGIRGLKKDIARIKTLINKK